MKIEKLEKVKGHKIFNDFNWPTNLPEFNSRNIIYGWNASGKTTLSNILYSLSQNENISEGTIKIKIDDRLFNNSEFCDFQYSINVKVFNRKYVEANVFPTNGSGKVEPIYVIGDQKGAEELDKKKALMNQISSKVIYIEKNYNNKEKTFNDFLTNKAAKISERMVKYDPSYKSYNKTKFEKNVEDLLNKNLIIEQKENLEKTLDAKPMKIVIKINSIYNIINEEELKTLFETRVQSKTIDRLIMNKELNSWVKVGFDNHISETNKTCPFCTAPLSDDFIDSLRNHFNKEFNDFMQSIDSMSSKIRKYLEDLDNITQSLPDSIKLHTIYSCEYDKEKKIVLNNINLTKQKLINVQNLISVKKLSPFESIGYKDDDLKIDGLDFSNLNIIIDKHNNYNSGLDSEQKKAKEQYEKFILNEYLDEYNLLKHDYASYKKALDQIKKKYKEVEQDIKALEKEIANHIIPAELINENLKFFLHRDDLKLVPRDYGYIIERNGSSIHDDLSEGERSAIAFIYFLESLSSTDFDKRNGIVVIDDPVSSLDSNNIYNAFIFMKSKICEINQIIILTHNFTFLSLVTKWFYDRNVYCDNHNKPRKCSFYQLRSYFDSRRCSKLETLNNKLLPYIKYQSEYSYLFSIVMEAYNKFNNNEICDIDYYQLPNIIRRLLEAFIAFRFPTVSNDESIVGKLDKCTEDKNVKETIGSFVNTYSHNNKIETDIKDDSIYQQAPYVINSVIEIIKNKDKNHFDEMVESISTETSKI